MTQNNINIKLDRELSTKDEFTKDEFSKLYRKVIGNEAKDSTINWALYKLLTMKKIKHIGREYYQIVNESNTSKSNYEALASDLFLKSKNLIAEKFPDIFFTIWETISLNEFVYHQLSRNIIFIDVEKNASESIFDLFKEYTSSTVLYRPNVEEYTKYLREETIVIDNLISEAPMNKENMEKIKVEKELVDLMSNKLIQSVIGKNELSNIYENIFTKYYVDEKTMFRYARRRNVEAKIKKFISNNTNIKLYSLEK
jgi:hypothetical protein